MAQGSATPAVHDYDAYGRQTKLIDQNAGTTTYEYNAAGELTKQTNANGQVTTMVYDVMGRVTSRTGAEGTTTTEYYPAGSAAINQVKKVTGFAGNLSEYTYDGYGRLSTSKETIDATAYTTSYTYNTYGDVTSKTFPSGFVTNHAYDANGYATTIKNGANTVTLFQAGSQNGLGQPLTYTLGNGKTATNTYEYGLPKRYYTPGVQDLNLTWTYSTGNLQKRQDALKNKEESFTYDNLNRLTASTVLGLTGQSINYSPNGNIASKTDAGSYSYLASKPNAVSAVTNPTNVIPALQQLVSYTAFMQPQVLTENNYELTYTYGADYERIKGVLKQNASLMRTRYYVGPGYEKDINAVSGVSRDIHYISSPAGLIGIVVREGSVDTYHYVYSDHLGSILTVTNSSGVVEAEQNFDAWGRRRNTSTWAYTGVTAPPDWLYRGYTGHEMLTEFNLINMNGRLYDPVVGRVLSPDNNIQLPDFTQNYNRYSYALNNPLRYTDPDGNFIGTIVGGIFGGITALIRGENVFGGIAKGAAAGLIADLAILGTAAIIGSGGALSPIAIGAIYGAVGGIVGGATTSAIEQLQYTGKIDLGTLGRSALIGGLFGGALGAIGGAIEGGYFRNAIKGQGFRSNDAVLKGFVANGATGKQEALDYFGLDAKYTSIKPAGGREVLNESFYGATSRDGVIRMGDLSFDSYANLRAVYFKELVHQTRMISGESNFALNMNNIAAEETFGFHELYKNRGLFSRSSVVKGAYQQIMSYGNTAQLNALLNNGGLMSPFVSVPNNAPWWHIIYKYPRF